MRSGDKLIALLLDTVLSTRRMGYFDMSTINIVRSFVVVDREIFSKMIHILRRVINLRLSAAMCEYFVNNERPLKINIEIISLSCKEKRQQREV